MDLKEILIKIEEVQKIIERPYRDDMDILHQLLNKVSEVMEIGIFKTLKFNIVFGDREENFYLATNLNISGDELMMSLGMKVMLWDIPNRFPDYDCTASFDAITGEVVVHVRYR